MNAHPTALRIEILAAYDAGETAQSLQARYGLSATSLRNWFELRAKTGGVEPRGHGGGRPRVMDDDGKRVLTELRQQFPEDGHEQLALRLSERGFQVSAGTVGRHLKALGFVRHAVKSSAKPHLSKRGQTSQVRRYRRAALAPDSAHRRAYPSDLTDPEWALLDPLVPTARPGGRPEAHPRRDIVNAIFYVLRSGCQWRMLPHDFPPWETVYDDFRRWRNEGVWESVNHILREKVRHLAGREKTPTAAIIDSQSVKTTERGGPVDMMAASA